MGLDENYLSFPKRASSIKFLVSLIPYNEIKQYKNYQSKIDTNDQEIITEESTKCELEILNNSKNVKDAHNIIVT